MRHFLTCSALLLAACAVELDVQPDDDGALSVATSALFADPQRTLNIVAHQDDDLGLMMPNLQRDLATPNTIVQTVYLTAGDAGFGLLPGQVYPQQSDIVNGQAPCQSYWAGRELGIKETYATMAGLPANAGWVTSTETFHGHLIRKLTLQGTAKQVTLVFIGLPNAPFGHPASLMNIWTNPSLNVQTVADGRLMQRETYDRAGLIDTLLQIITAFAPQHINTLDSTRTFGDAFPDDHPDHVASALFALAAKQLWATNHTTRMFRAYNIMNEESNLSSVDSTAKRNIWNAYWPKDEKICTDLLPRDMCTETGFTHLETCDNSAIVYEFQQTRQYTIGTLQGVTGLVRAQSTGAARNCLKATAASVGSTVVLATCDPASPLQLWQFRNDDTLRLNSTALCASSTFTAGTRGAGVVLQACGANVPSQKFALTTVGKLRGPDATCVQASGTALTTRECGAIAGQSDWTLQASSPVYTAASTGFSDTDVPNNNTYYDTFQLAQLNGDGRADACVRRSGGIYCAMGGAGANPTFGSSLLRSADFRDNNGWGGAAYGSTVQFADINGDGRADACGRRSDGIYCATWDNTSQLFTDYRKRSSGTTFSDWVGYQLSSSVYGSLRIVDVTGDGKADVCARNSFGIECADNLNSGNSFGAVSQWTSSEFTDLLNWRNDAGGTTIQFADIDGDGKVDVCGRGAISMICAINNGAKQFVQQHLWGRGGDFSDFAGWDDAKSFYGSIRLVDINGDNRADVCGRGFDGIVCGISLGTLFSQEQPIVAQLPFDNLSGWSPDRYGSTLSFGDLNNDGRQDLCLRGPLPGGGVGIRCALGYASAP